MSLLGLLLACTGPGVTPAPPPRRPLPPVRLEAGVVRLEVTTAPRAAPAGAEGPLALDPWAVDPERHPTPGRVAFGVCADRGDWRERLGAALDADGVSVRWIGELDGCGTPSFCAWARARVAASADPAGRADRAWLLERCDDPASRAMFDDAASPRAWVASCDTHPCPPDERVVQAGRLAMAEGDLWSLMRATSVLAESDDPEAGRMLLRLYGEAPPELRDTVARAMWGRSDPGLTRLFRAACAVEQSPSCRRVRTDPLADLDAALHDPGQDPSRLLAERPLHRTAILQALETCARGVEADGDWAGRRCLVALARADRARAASVAATLTDPWERVGDLRAALALGDAAALGARLEALGDDPVPADPTALTAADLWVAAGRGLRAWDDPRLPEGSRAHEIAAYALADAAGLTDAVFVEVLPRSLPEDPPSRRPRLTLYGWVDGRRFRTLVGSPESSALDLERVAGLVQAMLDHRAAARVLVSVDDWPATVVALTPAVRDASVDAGLLRLAELAEAADTGLPTETD